MKGRREERKKGRREEGKKRILDAPLSTVIHGALPSTASSAAFLISELKN